MTPILSYNIDTSRRLLYRRVNLVSSTALELRVSVSSAGLPVDITGKTVELYVWNAARNYETTIPGTLVTPALGTARIQVSAEDLTFPGNHSFNIRLLTDGEPSVLLRGDLVVHAVGTDIDYPTVFPGVWLDFQDFEEYRNVEGSGPYQFGNRLTAVTQLNGGLMVEVDVSDIETHLAEVDQAIDALEEDLDNKVDKTSVGVAYGVAPLDGDGKVPTQHIPVYTMISPGGSVWQLYVDDDGALVTNPLTPEA